MCEPTMGVRIRETTTRRERRPTSWPLVHALMLSHERVAGPWESKCSSVGVRRGRQTTETCETFPNMLSDVFESIGRTVGSVILTT